MGCCRKSRDRTTTRSVLCLQWVIPIRVLALLSLAMHIGIAISGHYKYSVTTTFAALIHVTVVVLLLNECRISSQYHAYLQDRTDG